ncbi:hypothetical protein E8E14_013760 [Neopestalotiopsis sp. 37M]|nr:hypothetical protein E8E14_013760 [Neopestalotiopsis sp. 37M]
MPPRTRSNASDNGSESPVPRPSQTRKRRRGRSIAEGQSQKRHHQQDDNDGPAQYMILVRTVDKQGLDLEQIPSQSAESPSAERVADADSTARSEAASTTIPARPPTATQSTSNAVVAQTSVDGCDQSDNAMVTVSLKFRTTNYGPGRQGSSFIIDIIDPKMFNTYIMHDGAWLLHEKFWKEYPELVDGLDANIMFKDGQLLPDFTAATGSLQ